MTWRIIQADVMEGLAGLAEGSVHCVVTSPPYWGLRNYGVEPSRWPAVMFAPAPGLASIQIPEMTCCLGLEPEPWSYIGHLVAVFRDVRRVLRTDGTCWVNTADCYAKKGMSGLSSKSDRSTLDGGANRAHSSQRKTIPHGLKVKDLVATSAMLALALEADGWWWRCPIIWAKPNPMPSSQTDRPTIAHEYVWMMSKSEKYFYDATAVEEAATYVGPNEPDAIKQPSGWDSSPGGHRELTGRYGNGGKNEQSGDRQKAGFNERWAKVKGGRNAFRGQGAERDGANGPANRDGRDMRDVGAGMTRTKRSVWTIATAPFSGQFCTACHRYYSDGWRGLERHEENGTAAAICVCGRWDAWLSHFASFPTALVEPCILAGTSERGCCPECGAPRRRVVEAGEPDLEHQIACGGDRNGKYDGQATKDYGSARAQDPSATKVRILEGMRETKTRGWLPTCACLGQKPEPGLTVLRIDKVTDLKRRERIEKQMVRLKSTPLQSCLVLDPFAGAGTTLLVAERLGRDSVGIEINPEYVRMATERIEADCPLFNGRAEGTGGRVDRITGLTGLGTGTG